MPSKTRLKREEAAALSQSDEGPPREPERQFEFVLHLVSRSILRFYNSHFRSLGLTSNEAGILLQLEWAGLFNQQEIAHSLGIGKAATGALIADLEARDLLQRRRNSRDARQIDVTLSEGGRAMTKKINARIKSVAPVLLSGVAEAQLQEVLAVLLRVHQNSLELADPSRNDALDAMQAVDHAE
jgi:DNA-binding MarR family transcriptional regulator